MSKKFLVQIVLVAFVATLGLTGCKGFKKPPAQPMPESGVPPLGSGSDVIIGERPIIGGSGILQHGQFAPVLFDYDSARVRPSEVSKIDAVAAYLKSNPGKLVIEGHCDERGTAEYNRALGERRALAARGELINLGIDASRISTISYGKDRPAEMAHDEAGWGKNRRCEFVVVGQ